ncbi:MAG: division/cell wall cluster transcriptional repressor MraZ [Firmicutes bacterium]|nr:division/cell wall cluster transcriptional repressor MraZ [Bacillota bacterium]
MFFGEFHHSVDEKGRIIMPTKYRNQLGETFYITIDLWGQEDEKCLCVYPESSFRELTNKLRTIGASDIENRKLYRKFYSHVQDTSTDKQGRVMIDQELRRHAGLEKDIVLAGQDDHIEIWDREKWEAYNQDDAFFNSSKLAEELRASGI